MLLFQIFVVQILAIMVEHVQLAMVKSNVTALMDMMEIIVNQVRYNSLKFNKIFISFTVYKAISKVES